jgi:hypothetical protein
MRRTSIRGFSRSTCLYKCFDNPVIVQSETFAKRILRTFSPIHITS